MKLSRKAAIQPHTLLLAPALTVSLLLVLFVFLSSSFLAQPGIAVKTPASPFLLEPHRNPVVVSITGPPKTALYFQNTEISPEELGQRLTQLRSPASVIIKADRHAPLEQVIQAANTALALNLDVVLATDTAPGLLPQSLKAQPIPADETSQAAPR